MPACFLEYINGLILNRPVVLRAWRPLTPQQTEALDMFDALANDPDLYLYMEFRAATFK